MLHSLAFLKCVRQSALALIGLGANFFNSRKSTIIASGVGIFGGILLIWLRVELNSSLGQISMIKITYEIGFWSILLLFFGAALVNLYLSK